MTYSAGQIISASDYNGFVNNTAGANVNATWGIGSSSAGYGQGALATVATGATITATQWAGLVNTIQSMGSHQGTAITSRTAPVVGDKITILSALNTDITNCYTNRGNAVATGTWFTGWTGTNSLTAGSPSGTSFAINNTITWVSGDAARHFFNAGGIIRILNNKTSTGATGDPEWNNLANNLMSLLYFTGGATTQTIAGFSYTGLTRSGGTGTPQTFQSTKGWYNIVGGSGFNLIYRQYSATAPYTSNNIAVYASINVARNVLTIQCAWENPEGDPITGGTAASGGTPGTAPCSIVTYYPPSTTYLTNSWGNPTIAATVV